MTIGTAIEANGGVATVRMMMTGFLAIPASLRSVPVSVSVILWAAVVVIPVSIAISVVVAVAVAVAVAVSVERHCIAPVSPS